MLYTYAQKTFSTTRDLWVLSTCLEFQEAQARIGIPRIFPKSPVSEENDFIY